MSSPCQKDSIKEGKERDEILFLFKAVGIAEIVLSVVLLVIGLITVLCGWIAHNPGWHQHDVSLSGYGVWCGLFSIPAGVMSISTSSKVTYFSVGWAFITSIIGSFFSFLLCVLSLTGALETLLNDWFDETVVFNFALLIFGIAQIVLCSYTTVVFGRLYSSYPYHIRHQDFLCPCVIKYQNQTNFANVMYSTIASKKHDY